MADRVGSIRALTCPTVSIWTSPSGAHLRCYLRAGHRGAHSHKGFLWRSVDQGLRQGQWERI